MNAKIRPSLVLAAVLASALCLWVGCNTTANTSAYKAAATTHVGVNTAMAAWNEWVGLKHPPASQELAVRGAFEKWQKSFLLVCDAGKVWAAGVSTNAPNLPSLSLAFQQAVTDAGQDQADLMNLLTSLGVKLPGK